MKPEDSQPPSMTPAATPRPARWIRRTVIAVSVLGAAAAGAAAIAAKNETPEANDALAAMNAKVSLVQAVTLAEQHLNGKATRAEFETGRQGPRYEIEIVSGTQVIDVQVDADKGVILSSAPDRHDGKDRDDDERDDERDNGHRDGKR